MRECACDPSAGGGGKRRAKEWEQYRESEGDQPLSRYCSHKPVTERCARAGTARGSTPVYSALGRMMRLLARCSNTWDAQPVTREQTKIGVNSLVGMPMKR